MKDRPDIADRELVGALAAGWRIETAAVRYAPVGGGGYHWVVRDAAGGRWFVTADDLDNKAWLGDTRAAVLGGLRAAMDIAVALREDAGLGFVAAPVRSADGVTVRPLGARYAISVFRYLDGTGGRFDQALTPAERSDLIDRLAALHQSMPVVTGLPGPAEMLPKRAVLEAALDELRQPWTSGPFAEPARALLAARHDQIRHLLRVFDDLAARVAASAGEMVLTHGEPHPGNLVWVGGQMMLIDWDTVGLGLPERDLWDVASEDGDGLRRYAAATGRAADASALALFRLRWHLDDTSCFVGSLRSRHGRTPGSEHDWQCLNEALSLAVKAAGDD